MKISYDLHIHSCLSPCGSDDMTPNNIMNMAWIKGLDVVAITDHNSGKNVSACVGIGNDLGVLVLPGMEVQTREEVHVLCYFPHVKNLETFETELDLYRMQIPNRPDRFGNQWIMNDKDEVVGEMPLALILSIDLSIDDLYALVERYEGIMIPAHVNKDSNSILYNLGFIPPHLAFTTLEVMKNKEISDVLKNNFAYIYNSDAHYLEDISEPENFLEVESKTIGSVIKALKRKELK
ncbi:phosphoesterase [Fusibacter tunisiensis]|uniref:PHP family Zn ribbon phosphoesterase n=1 Tax=Fusibacter tunisiensis TaxID=1008308 RepID=A0ABS2MRA5_9FIRM|nr:phosphoesterase [Fusibacter tunisiensis]MBM7561953.1 PHP family Zn ribbon phosphoesterase [Fusibacter tunisiensis]